MVPVPDLFTCALLWFGRRDRTPDAEVTLEAVADAAGVSLRTFMRWLTLAKEGKPVDAAPEARDTVEKLYLEAHNWLTLVAPFFLACWMEKDAKSSAGEGQAFSRVSFLERPNGFVECELELAHDFDSFIIWLRPSVRKSLKLCHSTRADATRDWKLEFYTHTYKDPASTRRFPLDKGAVVRFYLFRVFHEQPAGLA